MRNGFIRLLLVTILALCGTSVWAQITVKGQLVDADTGEPLIGAAITVEGTTQGSVSDIDGNFTQELPSGGGTLLFRYVGYADLKRKVSSKSRTVSLGVIEMTTDSEVLGDVVVTATMAVARKTPIAVSTVTPAYISEKLGGQEFLEVLKATPGVYITQQGGGYGDSEIFMRGFGQDNIAMNINGTPVNDMEWGGVYMSNWDGLRDVTRTMQTQRGLGASKVSAPSVGGTINIITRGMEAKKGGFISYGMGNDGANKIVISGDTGLSKKGWAMNFLLSKSWGDGYIQGTEYEAYTYYLQVSKQLNDNHQLSLTVLGSPQTHNQRNSNDGLTLSGWEMTRDVYGVKDYRYNPTYGHRKDGRMTTGGSYNVYHKPQITLTHQWQIDYKSSLSTSLYTSIGRGYGQSGQATYAQFTKYSYQDWYGSSYGTLRNTFRNTDGTFDYAAIEDLNAGSEYGSQLVMSRSKNYHDWYGLLSTYTTKIGNDIDFYGGVDFRYYKGIHTNELSDLYGGAYYMDSSRGSVFVENNKNAASDAWKYQKLGVGDVVYRDYDGYVLQEGGFFQAEYNKDKLSAFVSGSLSNTSYWRYDRYYYDAEHAKSKTVSYIGFTAKGGANYNLSKYHNVFANVGYISRAPKFSGGAFFTSTTSNLVNPNAKNEKIFSVEAGYGWRNKWINVNVNGYYTLWMDKTMTKTGTLDNQGRYVMNMEGVDAKHMGVEVEAKSRPLPWLELTGMFSIGDWKWNSDAHGLAYDEFGNAVRPDGTITTPNAEDQASADIKLKGVKVGGAAQLTAALGANVDISKAIRVGVDWNYYGNNYAYYSFSGSTLTLGKEVEILAPWKVPAAMQVDLNASYKFDIAGLHATLSGNVNNLFNEFYLRKAFNPNATVTTSYAAATKDNVYGFYSFGRTFNLRLKVNF